MYVLTCYYTKLNVCNYLRFNGDSHPDKVLGESQALFKTSIA